jgi:nuclear mRNA export protein PCID2/THP1
LMPISLTFPFTFIAFCHTVLEKYGLPEFTSLIEGIQKGDLRTFQNGLIKYQDGFIRQGTYLMLEKCKTVCYRNLFKRVYKILDKHQISLNHVASTFKWLGMPMDLDEIECIMANLIFRGYVRGYLSHQKRILVLSKRDPFPTSSVILK